MESRARAIDVSIPSAARYLATAICRLGWTEGAPSERKLSPLGMTVAGGFYCDLSALPPLPRQIHTGIDQVKRARREPETIEDLEWFLFRGHAEIGLTYATARDLREKLVNDRVRSGSSTELYDADGTPVDLDVLLPTPSAGKRRLPSRVLKLAEGIEGKDRTQEVLVLQPLIHASSP